MLKNKLVYERWQGSKSQLQIKVFFFLLEIALKERDDDLTEHVSFY